MPAANDARSASDGMLPEDWDLLHRAVTERLRSVAQSPAAACVRDVVEECVHELERLHAMLAQERAGLRRLETQLHNCRTELQASHASERRANFLAQHDSLTQLPNRSQFRRRVDDALSTIDAAHSPAPALAVLFLDLDGFKPINDRLGHDTGDALLRIVAQRLRRAVRAEDIVCRLGGDEFACLVSQPMGHAQLGRLAHQLFDAISAPLRVGAMKLTVRPSIGIAVCPTDGDSTTALLQRADAAMYRAKRCQTGYAFYDSESDLVPLDASPFQ